MLSTCTITSSQPRDTGAYAPAIEISRKRLRREAIAWRLLLLSALGSAFSNILIFRPGGFAVTPAHLLLISATFWVLRQKRRLQLGLVFPIAMMLLFDGYHAVVSGYARETEWLKSFVQLGMYGLCFIVLASFRPSAGALKGIASWAAKLGFILGGISILQFALLNFGVSAYMPEGWAVRTADFSESISRYGGFYPATGLATEPAYYALGLVSLAACLLFFHGIGLLRGQRLFWLSLLVLFGGILATFSLTGVVAISVVLLAWIGTQRKSRLTLVLLLMVGAIVIVGANIGVVAPIQARLQQVLAGADNSSQHRTVAAVRLLFAEPDSLENFIYGTGLGMEERGSDTYLRIYSEASLRELTSDEVKIHNILTAIRFFQGWLGIALYGLLLWAIFLPGRGSYTAFFSMFVFFVIFHFASGLYLSPGFWSLLALIALLRRIQLGRKAFSVLSSNPA